MNVQRKPEAPVVQNESGLEIKPVYTAADIAASRALEPGAGDGIGLPGEYPFTRGIHPLMYRKQPWTMRQYTGFGNAEDTNKRFKYLIATGNTGLNVAFDLPTQCGLDSDDPMAMGEVGRVGMAIDTLKDMEIAFDGIDIEKITVSLTINGAAAILRRTISSKSSWAAAPGSIRSSPRSASSPTRSSIARARPRSTARSACAGTTSANRAPIRPRTARGR